MHFLALDFDIFFLSLYSAVCVDMVSYYFFIFCCGLSRIVVFTIYSLNYTFLLWHVVPMYCYPMIIRMVI